ncbi:LuxR C-terminal-related transcriptional regulator [Nocardioides sp.]|uniref:LuxR C-terminal-related transcriptional regulator n=1 Tax=Nocardioides sp. TaxID=35761 RepID=UPI003D0C90D4
MPHRLPELEQAYAAIAATQTFGEFVQAAEDAVRTVGGDGVSIGVLRGNRVAIVYRGTASPLLEDLDSVLAADELPGPDAMRTGHPVYLSSQSVTIHRFPASSDRVAQLEFEAAACLPLLSGESPLGFLVAHYLKEQDFDDTLRVRLGSLAATCSGALDRLIAAPTREDLAEARSEHVRRALESRARLEQATGILIERCDLSPASAAVAIQAMVAESGLAPAEVARLLVGRRRIPGLAASAEMARASRRRAVPKPADLMQESPLEALATSGEVSALSPQEAEIVRLVTTGATNREIADQMYLSINSVKTYIRSAYRKIGVTNRAQAVLWGVRNGYLPPVSQDQQVDAPRR